MWRLATRRGAVLYDKMDHDGGRHLHPAATPAPPLPGIAAEASSDAAATAVPLGEPTAAGPAPYSQGASGAVAS